MTTFIDKRLIDLRGRRGPLQLSRFIILALIAVVVASLCKLADSSEFPERECCDDLMPSAADGGLDIRKTTPSSMAGNGGGTTPSSFSSFSTETPPHPSEHPDTSNFLYPEFIPELSLDLGYPLPPPPSHPHHQHPHPPDGANYVPTTTGTGKLLIHLASNRQTGEQEERKKITLAA